jgi:hypothetical protein
MHLAAGLFQQLDGGEADARAKEIDQAGDEQGDARCDSLGGLLIVALKSRHPLLASGFEVAQHRLPT